MELISFIEFLNSTRFISSIICPIERSRIGILNPLLLPGKVVTACIPARFFHAFLPLRQLIHFLHTLFPFWKVIAFGYMFWNFLFLSRVVGFSIFLFQPL